MDFLCFARFLNNKGTEKKGRFLLPLSSTQNARSWRFLRFLDCTDKSLHRHTIKRNIRKIYVGFCQGKKNHLFIWSASLNSCICQLRLAGRLQKCFLQGLSSNPGQQSLVKREWDRGHNFSARDLLKGSLRAWGNLHLANIIWSASLYLWLSEEDRNSLPEDRFLLITASCGNVTGGLVLSFICRVLTHRFPYRQRSVSNYSSSVGLWGHEHIV